METCRDCRIETSLICQFHELALHGDWFGELEVRIANALGPDALEPGMLDQLFDALTEDDPLAWTAMCCHHDLPIGTCIIPTCHDLPSYGDHAWKVADRAIGSGISLN